MRRSIYSKNPEWPQPIFEIYWDRSALMIEARDGTLDNQALHKTIQHALAEIVDAIKKGKANAQKQSGDSAAATAGTPEADAQGEPVGASADTEDQAAAD